MSNCILAHREKVEKAGRAFLDTLNGVSESSITNPLVIGSRLINELIERGLIVVEPIRDGIFRRDMALKVLR